MKENRELKNGLNVICNNLCNTVDGMNGLFDQIEDLEMDLVVETDKRLCENGTRKVLSFIKTLKVIVSDTEYKSNYALKFLEEKEPIISSMIDTCYPEDEE